MVNKLSEVKVVIVGGSSFVGTYLMRSLSNLGLNVIGTYMNNPREGLKQLDVTDKNTVNSFIIHERPNTIINSMTFPADKCEKEPELADKLIVQGARNLTGAAMSLDAKLIHCSTDYVYGGGERVYKETDTPNPINFYGNAKARSEDEVLVHDKSVILRLSGMYGYNGEGLKNGFLGWLMNQKGDISVGNVQKKHDLYLGDVAGAAFAFSLHETVGKTNLSYGVYNLGGPDLVTKYELAQSLREFAPNVNSISQNPVLNSSYPIPERIEMDLSKASSLGLSLTSAKDSVPRIKDTMEILKKN